MGLCAIVAVKSHDRASRLVADRVLKRNVNVAVCFRSYLDNAAYHDVPFLFSRDVLCFASKVRSALANWIYPMASPLEWHLHR